MTQAQQGYKKDLIRLIQINKSKVFANDTERKEFMQSRFGVDSTKRMSISQLELFLKFCLGKVSDLPYFEYVPATEPQIHKIKAIWAEKGRDKSETALLKFVLKPARRQGEKAIESLYELTKEEAKNVIVALERMKS